MPENNLILTPTGLQKLIDELEELKKVRRKDVARKIKEAKEHGDLSENAEYAAAKEEQGIIEGRIIDIEHKIKTAEIAEKTEANKDTIMLGSRVVLKKGDETFEYEIVGTNEVDPEVNKISNESPLGKALMGKSAGVHVEYTTPDGKQACSIESIE
ncbi:transcription elongation factor GreA [Patescibacteria group bacterium]